jgi:acetolactate synthase I/II/III large subunit
MNRLSGAEALVRMLQLHGVRHIFGLCGDTSLPLYDALFRLDHGITHVLTRDERSAAYMADAYARVTGRVGVCEGPSGGGATYILPGVVEANESSIPVLAITTDIAVGSRGRYVLTELDQEALFRPLTKWNRMIDRAAQIPGTVRAAFRHMTTGRPGAAHIGLPFDVQKDAVDEAAMYVDPGLGSYPARRQAPEPAATEAAATAILSAKRPLLICGGGPVIAGAQGELRALAELLEAPVATTIGGKGAIAEDHPLALGVVGSNGGTPETRTLVDEADMIVFIGCRAGSVTIERWRHPAPGKVRVVHIDIDPAVIGVNYPTEAALVSDARLALAALHDELVRYREGASDRAFGRKRVARAKSEKFAGFQKLAASDAAPLRPERIVATLQELLPRDALVVVDAGTPCPYLSAYYELRSAGRHFITNRAHGALGYALPAAIGAQIGRPAARCVAIMGDGSFGFASGELETIARLGLPIAMVVIANAAFGWIKAGQKSGFAERYFAVDFTPGQHARIAEAYGIRAWRVEHPAELRPALAAALETGGPSLVDVVTQPLHEARAPVSEWVA